MEARLARNGYDVKVLTEMIAAKPKDIRSFLRGRLPPERTQELHDQLLAVACRYSRLAGADRTLFCRTGFPHARRA